MAITLQHEAYRDGIKSWDNKAETYQAVLAHTLMASKLAAKDTSFLDQKLNMDLLAFSLGGIVFSKYVDGAYDSSADYWKLAFGPGGVQLVWDEHADTLTLPDGTVIKTDLKAGEKADEISRATLARLLFGKMNDNGKMVGGDTDANKKVIGELFSQNWEVKDNTWVKKQVGRWAIDTTIRDGAAVNITSFFDKKWTTLAGGAIADWVDRGAVFNESDSGNRREYIANRTDELFARSNITSILDGMRDSVVLKPNGEIDISATKKTFRNSMDATAYGMMGIMTSGSSIDSLYAAKLSTLTISAYAFMLDTSSVAPKGYTLGRSSQSAGPNAAYDYGLYDASGSFVHNATDGTRILNEDDEEKAWAGLPVRTPLGGRVSQSVAPLFVQYLTEESYFEAQPDNLVEGTLDYIRWHYPNLRHDTNSPTVTVQFGFQFGDYFVSSNMYASYLHMANPAGIGPIEAGSQIGILAGYGASEIEHMHQSYFRPRNSKQSFFEYVFGNTVSPICSGNVYTDAGLTKLSSKYYFDFYAFLKAYTEED